MAIENDYRQGMCEIEKDLKVVSLCNSSHWKYDGWKGLRNACKIGFSNNKIAKAYVVTLERNDEGEEILKVHTIKRNKDDIIETLEGNLARKIFSQLMFY